MLSPNDKAGSDSRLVLFLSELMPILLFSLILTIGSVCCIAQTAHPDAYVARAGERFISEREFLERFELTPGLYRNQKMNGEREKRSFLTSLIAEKLLAQEAEARSLQEQPSFQTWFTDIRKLLARDEFYRREISSAVSLSEPEIAEGMKRARLELLVRFVYVEEESTAHMLHEKLHRGMDMHHLQIDSSLHAISDTATVIWGDADTTIEDAAYALRRNELSHPISAEQGYYLIQLISRTSHPKYGTLPNNVLRERVISQLRRRKEEARLGEFLEEFMKGQTAYSNGGTFRRFVTDIAESLSDSGSFDEKSYRTMLVRTQTYASDTIALAGSRSWTVGEAIETLYRKGFSSEAGRPNSVGSDLYREFQSWVGHEILEQEALRRGYDTIPEILNQLAPWKDHALATMMKQYAAQTVSVSDADVYRFLKSNNPVASTPRVRIREFKSGSLGTIKEVVDALGRGTPFTEILVRWSNANQSLSGDSVSAPFPITDRNPLGEIAWSLNPGQPYGPIQDSTGFSIIEVISKDRPSVGSPETTQLENARRELLRMKQKRTLDLFLAQSASKRGYAVFGDRLRKLTVSSIPMLAFRFLGFGGRMFAAPFVDQQAEWMNVDPPEEPVIP